MAINVPILADCNDQFRPRGHKIWTSDWKNTTDQTYDVSPGNHLCPIEDPPKTPRTSQHYRIEGAFNWSPIMLRDTSLSTANGRFSKFFSPACDSPRSVQIGHFFIDHPEKKLASLAYNERTPQTPRHHNGVMNEPLDAERRQPLGRLYACTQRNLFEILLNQPEI